MTTRVNRYDHGGGHFRHESDRDRNDRLGTGADSFLVEQAAKILGVSPQDLRGLTDRAVKCRVIRSSDSKVDLSTKCDDYVNARYNLIVEDFRTAEVKGTRKDGGAAGRPSTGPVYRYDDESDERYSGRHDAHANHLASRRAAQEAPAAPAHDDAANDIESVRDDAHANFVKGGR